MTLFIQNDATGAGAGNLDPNQAAVDLAIITNGDTGLGLNAPVGNIQQVTYARTDPGIPPTRLATLVNTNFGVNPQNVDIVILPVLANFTLNDGTSILAVGGIALPPTGSGLPGANLNNTNRCLAIYDTTQNNGSGYCTARNGTGGTLDLPTPNPVILYHELSHAFRTVTNASLALTQACNPSSPEENAAITDENDLRNQIAAATGAAPELRDPGIHCGTVCAGGGASCCIIASVASGSPLSEEVGALRAVRDGLLRKTEIGFAFFQSLFRDYYGFSPQVCALMARQPILRPLVLDGFVRPLVRILRLIERHAVHGQGQDAAALGESFAAEHIDRAAAAGCLEMLDRASLVIEGDKAGLTEPQQELARLLSDRALSSRHVAWALVEPVGVYRSALRAYHGGCGAVPLGVQLQQAIATWAARMPLDDAWASLSAAELRDELGLLERTLLRAPETRTSFRDRLRRAFGATTAVATVLGEEAYPRTGEQR